ncbi:MAG: hypothetical protein JWN36_2130 [Microbacteriaceae bacterium]|nr:hypothetical protein [Microbacteriaceae bacterium]
MSATPPPLDDLAGEWLTRHDLVHLHSLRNQWGQAHVNGDLTSLSWVAIPPFSGGYHTGALRVGGRVLAASEFRWAPWGVERVALADGVRVHTDTRMVFEGNEILWRVTVTNETDAAAAVTLRQELLAPFAHSEVDWGWLYGTPWNAGHHHDFYATERLRAEALADEPRQVQLLPHDARPLRLGRPRVPGIQRDEDDEPMLMDSALPDHTAPDSQRVREDSAFATVRGIEVDHRVIEGTFALTARDSEVRLEAVPLRDGSRLCFDVTVEAGMSGVLLTHGNHPDSLQLGLEEGAPWLAIGGERVHSRVLLDGTHRFAVTVGERAVLEVDGVEVAGTAPWWGGQRWTASAVEGGVLVRDSRSPAHSAYAFATAPDVIRTEGSRAFADWAFALAPGESREVAWALAIGTDDSVVRDAAALASAFPASFAAVADRWRSLWRNAFVPGNPDHSGYLPVLDTEDAGLARTYYLGALLALYMRNTGVSELGPVFLTGGPRLGPTVTFYWDISEWARTAAMLEPSGMRAWILAALAQPYDRSHSFDTRNLLPVGNHYAANDHALFTTVKAYVGVTGDAALLDEVAGRMTVLDHLRSLASRPRSQRSAFGAGVLVDLGDDPWELLECVPNYRDAVVSFNAGYVGMLRDLAVLLRRRGDEAGADDAEHDASALAAAVLGQYAGAGRWRISHPDGDDVIGHCLDFELVAADMAEDLSPEIRAEMIDFVTTHLIDGDWMHALSPDDPVAPFSDRPDHGAAGAFAGWPGSTSYALSVLGRPDLAAAFLSRLHRSTSGALWGQAVEAIGGGRYRVAERGISNRESTAAVGVTEAVIAGLFGIRPGFEEPGERVGRAAGEFGELRGIRVAGYDLPARAPIAT